MGKTNHSEKQHEDGSLCQEFAFQSELGRILEYSLNEIYVFDAETLEFLCANLGARKNLGYSFEELAGLSPLDIKPAVSETEFAQLLAPLRSGETERLCFETLHRRKDGSDYNIEIHLQLDTFHGRPAFVAIGRDTTQRKAIETSLKLSEERSRSILETAASAILTIDEKGVIASANLATEDIFGYRQEELVGNNIKMLMPSPFHGEHDDYLARYLKTGERKIIGVGREVTARRKDGRVFPIDLAVGEVHLEGGRRLFTGIIRDLSKRKALEDKLLSVSEDERRTIGREIHDDLCQRLFGIGCLVKVLQGQAGEAPEGMRRGITELSRMVTDANSRAREMAHGLMPVALESDGLMGALKELAQTTQHASAISCHFRCDHPVLLTDNSAIIQLYRIAQEALKNAVEHGSPSRIDLELSATDSRATLEIRDDGSGFSASDDNGKGMGLLTMRHRARTLGGNLEIQNDAGTVVTCSIPLPTTEPTPSD